MKNTTNSTLIVTHLIMSKSLDYKGAAAFALRNEMPIFVPYLKGNY